MLESTRPTHPKRLVSYTSEEGDHDARASSRPPSEYTDKSPIDLLENLRLNPPASFPENDSGSGTRTHKPLQHFTTTTTPRVSGSSTHQRPIHTARKPTPRDASSSSNRQVSKTFVTRSASSDAPGPVHIESSTLKKRGRSEDTPSYYPNRKKRPAQMRPLSEDSPSTRAIADVPECNTALAKRLRSVWMDVQLLKDSKILPVIMEDAQEESLPVIMEETGERPLPEIIEEIREEPLASIMEESDEKSLQIILDKDEDESLSATSEDSDWTGLPTPSTAVVLHDNFPRPVEVQSVRPRWLANPQTFNLGNPTHTYYLYRVYSALGMQIIDANKPDFEFAHTNFLYRVFSIIAMQIMDATEPALELQTEHETPQNQSVIEGAKCCSELAPLEWTDPSIVLRDGEEMSIDQE